MTKTAKLSRSMAARKGWAKRKGLPDTTQPTPTLTPEQTVQRMREALTLLNLQIPLHQLELDRMIRERTELVQALRTIDKLCECDKI